MSIAVVARHPWRIAVLLGCLMLITRMGHVAWWPVHFPDASMAVFFLGGWYVRRSLPLAGLLLLAVAIDWFATQHAGVSRYCLTPAYACLPAAYAVMWYGGSLCAHRTRSSWVAFAAALPAAALSFLVSNGSFYWLGGVSDPKLSGWLVNLADWAPVFIGTTLAYVGVVLLAQTALSRMRAPHAATRTS